jgi:excisionase family DNA binding protein
MTEAERITRYKETRKHPRGPTKRLYSMQEAACYLGRTVDALREMIWAGKLPFFRDGKRILLDVKDMDEFIDRNKTRFTY